MQSLAPQYGIQAAQAAAGLAALQHPSPDYTLQPTLSPFNREMQADQLMHRISDHLELFLDEEAGNDEN